MGERVLDLGWMRILVEAARRGSFSAAAASLGTTQPAVSYQIRRLEDQVGFQVLKRLHNGVELTRQGRRLFEIAETAVDKTDALVRETASAMRTPVVRLHTDYAISALWLIPRMHLFRELHPRIEIQIIATQRLDAEAVSDNDVAIAFGRRGDFGPQAQLILPESVVPVCSPAFRARHAGVPDAELLASARLIHLDTTEPAPWFEWSGYFAQAAISRSPPPGRADLSFNTYSLVTQATLEQEGIALGWISLVEPMLRAGSLVPVGAILQAPDRGYWLLSPVVDTPESKQLVAWLLVETPAT